MLIDLHVFQCSAVIYFLSKLLYKQIAIQEMKL